MPTLTKRESGQCIAFQSFDPHGKILQDFSIFVDNYPALSINGKSNYLHLIAGNPFDSRAILNTLSFTATQTEIVTLSYYRRNEYETHPKISYTLDWFERVYHFKQGRNYQIDFANIVLGTLLASSANFKSIVSNYNEPGKIPGIYLFSDNIQNLIDYWNSLYPPPVPIDYSKTADHYTLTDTTPIPPEAVYQISVSTSVALTRVMAANNDKWGYGTNVIAKNRPPNNHQIFQFDHQKLFETPQSDGSYGEYMTDSPRILELWQTIPKIVNIWNAIDAETYGEDPDQPGIKRVANLGWGIMKIMEVLGIRRQPNGKYLTTAESKKYERTRENAPTWKQGDYGIDEWGKFGMASRYLPTTYKDGQRQDDQWDIVHDFPQLLASKIDQLDHALNIQHGSEIRIPVGKEVQAYPNQGAATIDTAARIIQLERMVEQLLVMNIETSNSVRELFPGIGIPITTKAVKVDVGGQIRDIQYPGYQQSKPSMAESIGSLKSNLAIALGALMPRKSPKKNPLNPWSKDK
jgi:hypothetical protein